jgi:hypothetical protein
MTKEDEKIFVEFYGGKKEEVTKAFENLRLETTKEIISLFEISTKLLGYPNVKLPKR